ncbi:beta strand repeat-containing protein [Rhodopirellula islandica]|nr:tandem-95 repeat protein [Rhodopirellula islandica]
MPASTYYDSVTGAGVSGGLVSSFNPGFWAFDPTADVDSDLTVTIGDTDEYIDDSEKASVGFTVSGLDSDATAEVTFSDGTTSTKLTVTNGSDTVNLSSFADGPITATIVASDNGGNTATASDSSTKDSVAPVIDSVAAISVQEHSANFSAPFLLTATETSGLQNWQIAGGNLDIDGDSNLPFAIDSSGEITIADADDLDFEFQPSFDLMVTVDDSAGQTSAAETVTINLSDVSESVVLGAALFVTGNGHVTVLKSPAGNIEFYGEDAGGNPVLITSHVASNVEGISVTGQDNVSDLLTIDIGDLTDGTSPIDVVFEGGLNGVDTLEIIDSSSTSHTLGTHNFVTESDGSVVIDGGSTITYTGLEPITDAAVIANRVFDFAGGAETISLTTSSNPSFDLFIDSDTFGESVDFLIPTATLSITNSGSGADTINLSDISSEYTGPISVTGGDGNDDLNGSVTSNETAVFSGNLADYTLTMASGDITVADTVGTDGTDTVADFENLEFADVTISTAAPVITSVAVPANNTYVAGDALDFTVTFDKDISVSGTPTLGLTIGSTAVSASLLGPVSGSTATFRYTVMTGELDTNGIEVDSLSAGLEDANINGNAADNTLVSVGSTTAVLVDAVAPTVVLSTSQSSPTNANPIPFEALFSESVLGLQENEITVTGGVVQPGSLGGSGNNYSFFVVPSGQGPITVQIDAAAAYDYPANNDSVASNIVSITYDSVAPTVTITDDEAGVANIAGGDVIFTFEFSEDVIGFDATDVVVAGGTKSTFTAVDGNTYTLAVTPDPNSTTDITVDVAASVAADAASNPNVAATQAVQAVDTTAPSVAITDDEAGVANIAGGDVVFTFEFSEDVIGFDATDVVVAGGTKGAFTAVDGNTYTLAVTPDAGSTTDITVDVAASVAVDAASNPNLAATQAVQAVDTVAPTVVITDDEAGVANIAGGDVVFTFEFSEDVTGFDATDVVVAGGTKSTFTAVDGNTYTLAVTPDPNSTTDITVDVAASVAADAASNPNVTATQAVQAVDTTAPSVAITDDEAGVANIAGGDVIFTFEFSEDMTGFDASDVNVVGGTKGTFTAVDGNTYTLAVTPDAGSTTDITVDVAASVAVDAASNPNLAATQAVQAVDTEAPDVGSVNLTSGLGTYKIGDTIEFVVNFAEPVTIDETGGSPQLNMFFGSGFGGDNRVMAMTSSTATSATFQYTVVEGDLDTDGVRRRGLRSDLVQVNEFLQGSVITDAAGNNLATVATNLYFLNQDFAGLQVDGVKPTISSLSLDDTAISEADDSNTATLTVTFSEPMDTGVLPTVTSNAGTTLTLGSGSWATPKKYEVAYTVVDADVELADVQFDISGAKDAAGIGGAGSGNEMVAVTGLSTTLASAIDTIAPAGYGIMAAGDGNLTAAEAAADSVDVTGAEVGTGYTLTVSSDGGGTDVVASGTVVSAAFNIPVDVSSLNNGNLTYSLTLTDSFGNEGVAATDTSVLDKDTPTVTSVTATPITIHDSNVGSGLEVVIVFDTTMDTAVAPNISFVSPSITGTTTQTSSTWSAADTTLTLVYSVTDADEFTPDVDIAVADGQDIAGNVQAAYTETDAFSINTAGYVYATVLEEESVDFNISVDGTNITAFDSTAATHGTLFNLGSGTVRFVPDSDYFGPASFGFTLASGLVGTAFVTVTPVNDVPSFTVGPDQTVLEDAGPTTVNGFLGAISKGPSNESGQSLTTIISNTNAGLFSAQPAIDPVTGDLTFTPTADANGTSTVTVQLMDSGGTLNGGFDTTATQTFVINVTAVNDEPSFTIGGSQTVTEDAAPQTVPGFVSAQSAGPADESGQVLTYTVTNSDNALFTVQPSIDSVTGDLTYTLAPDAFGTATVTVVLSDNGGTANVGADDTADAQMFDINITADNDAPDAGNVTLTSGTEDTAKTITEAELLASSSDTEGDTMSVGSVVVFSGGGDIALTSPGVWTYTPAANYNGPVVLGFTVSDDGTPMGSDTAQASFNLAAVNDSPVNDVPGAQTVVEDGTLTFESLTSNEITVSDVDVVAGTNLLEVTLSVSHGALTLSGIGGLFLSSGTGSADSAMTFQGTALAINTALEGLTYSPTANYNGADLLTIVTSDLGNTGDVVNVLVDTDTVAITVTPVNDDPTVANPITDVTVNEDSADVTIDLSGVFADLEDDAMSTPLTLTAISADGSLVTANIVGTDLILDFQANQNGATTVTVTAEDSGGLTVDSTFNVVVDPVNDAPVAVDVTLANTNEDTPLAITSAELTANSTDPEFDNLIATTPVISVGSGSISGDALTGFTFTPATDYNGPVELTFQVTDDGTPSAATSANTATASFTVNAVNDAPYNAGTLPAAQSVNEDIASGLNLAAIEVADVDSTNLSVILAVGSGILTATTGGGVTVTNPGTSTVTLVGTKSAINAFLDGPGAVVYQGAADDFGAPGDTLTISLSDGVAAAVALPSIDINIAAVNDAPNFTLGADQSNTEDDGSISVPGFLTGLDAGAANESSQTLTVAVSNDSSSLFTATGQPAISLVTGELTYELADNQNGTAVVTVVVSDDGATSNGGFDSTTHTFEIEVAPANDDPDAGDVTLSDTTEDNALTFTDIDLLANTDDIDLPGDTLTVTAVNVVTGSGSISGSSPNWTFTPAGNFKGLVELSFAVSDGNGGNDTAIASFNVTSVNDDPYLVGSLPATITVDEDVLTTIGLNTAQLDDVDVGLGNLTVTFSSSAGGKVFVTNPALTITGSGSSTVNVTGTLANLNSFLAGSTGSLQFQGALNANGSPTHFLTLIVTDNGNTGAGGGGSVILGTVPINITPVNDAPTFTGSFPTGQTVGEDDSAALDLSGVTLQDVDAGTDDMELSLSAASGSLSVAGTSLAVSGSASVLTVTGSRADINALLAGTNGAVTFTPDANDDTDVDITVSANDLGHNPGAALPSVTNLTLSLDILPQNDPPTSTGTPADITVDEETDTNVDLSSIVLADIDAGSEDTELTISSGAGAGIISVDLASHTNVATASASGTSVVLTGSLADLNALLQDTSAVSYEGATDVVGTNVDTITVDFSDLGNTGTGATGTITAATVNVSIDGINDGPTVTGSLPADITVFEETTTAVDMSGAVISDVDAGAGTTMLTLTTGAGNGAVSIAIPGPLVGLITLGGTPQALTASGTLADLNALLQSVGAIKYTGATDTIGTDADTITVEFDDLGNTGIGGALDVTVGVISVDIDAVNDAPTVTMPASLPNVAEDSIGSLSPSVVNAITGITVSDVDAGAAPLDLELSVANGSLTAVGSGGVTVADSGTGTITLTGSQTDLNAYLSAANVTYSPTGDFNGTETLSATVNDGGASGFDGTPLTGTGSVGFTVTEVNDLPIAPPLNAYSTDEDIPLLDADMLVGATPGPANEVSQSLTLIGGTQPANGTVVYDLLSGEIDYTPDLNFNGTDTFTITLQDNGTTNGVADPLTITRVVNITVDPINDDPSDSNSGGFPTTLTVNEDEPGDLDLSSVNLVDVDAGTDPIVVTISSTATGQLSATTGGGVTVGGDGTATLTLTGTVGDLNTFLGDSSSVQYTNVVLNANGPAFDTIDVKVNDQGNNGAGGGADVALGSIDVTVTPVNDAPTFDLLGDQTANENSGAASISGFLSNASVGPADEVLEPQTLDPVVVSNNNTLLFSVQPAIDGSGTLTFTPALDANGTATVTVSLSDDGGSAHSGNDTGTMTFVITIESVNSAPEISVPMTGPVVTPVSVLEDETTPTGFGTVSISDVDAGADDLEVTLAVASGTLTLGTSTGLDFTVGDGVANLTMTFTGDLTDINAALATLTYLPSANFNGMDALTIDVDDQGNNGLTGGDLTDTETIPINVIAVNDNPTNTVPAGPIDVDENGMLALTTITVSDVDVDPAVDAVEVELTVAQGTLSLGTLPAGVSITSGAEASATVTIMGTFDDVNLALANLEYTPTTNYEGPDSLVVTTNDLGNTGVSSSVLPGGALNDVDTISLNVTPINTPPEFTGALPTSVSMEEDATEDLDFGTLQIDDSDDAGGLMTMTITASAGTLSTLLATEAGSTPTSLIFSGTEAALNAILSTAGQIQYQGPTDQNNINTAAAPEIEVLVSDEGNTGAGPVGGYEVSAGTFEVDLTATNDAPVITAPLMVSVGEDSPLSFTAGDAISIADVDIDETASAVATVTLTATNGTLTLDNTGLAFATGDGDSDTTMTFDGSLADINAALATLVFNPDADYFGPATLDIDVDDNGNTGTGAGTVSETVNISVVADDDAPAITVPAAETLAEDSSKTFSVANSNAISVSDVDSSPEATLSVAHGVLTLASTTGLVFTVGDGTADSTMTFSGTPAAITAALDGLLYTPTINYNGTDTLSITAADGTGSVSDSVGLIVTPVNDPPQNLGTLPVSVSVVEDLPGDVDLSAINLFDVDASGGSLTVTLATTGGGTLSAVDAGGVTVGSTGTSTITLTGTTAALNTFLDNASAVQFTGDTDANGLPADSIDVSVTDNGSTGSGAMPNVALGNVAVNITPVNDAPTFDVGPDPTVAEDSAGPIAGFVSNVLAGPADEMEAVALSIVDLDDSSSSLFASGPTINAAGDLVYTLNPDANGTATFKVKAEDAGTPAESTTSSVITFTVTPDDDPTSVVALNLGPFDEDEVVTFNVSELELQATDVDSTVTVTDVDYAGSDGVLSGPDGSGEYTFTPNANFIGSVSIDFTVTGSNAASSTIDFTYEAVNDAPSITIPTTGLPTGTEGDVLTVTGVSVDDADSDDAGSLNSNVIQLDITSTDGAVGLASDLGLVSESSVAGGIRLTGTKADINTVLATELRFEVGDVDPGAAVSDTATLTFTVDDLGNVGSGGAQSTTETLDLVVTDKAPALTLSDNSTAGVHNEGPSDYLLTITGYADGLVDPLTSLLIRWGDGTTTTVDDVDDIDDLNNGLSITVDHVFDDDSDYSPDLEVDAFTQGNLLQFQAVGSFLDSRTQNLDVANVAPSVTQAAALSPFVVGQDGSFQILATDPSVSDTGDLIYSVDWDGDLIFDDFGFSPILTIPGSVISAPGPLTINWQVDDQDGGVVAGTTTEDVLTPFTFTIEDVEVNEDDGTAVFVVTVDNAIPAAAGDIDVTLNFLDSGNSAFTATLGSDFNLPASTTLTFNSLSSLTQSVAVPIVDNGDVEPIEVFGISMSATTSVVGIVANVSDLAFGTILDDDSLATLQVSGVQVSSTTWAPDFKDAADMDLIGSGDGKGYTIPTGLNQTKVLPWSGINQLRVQFTEDVDLSTVVVAGASANVILHSTVNAGTPPIIVGTPFVDTDGALVLTLNKAIPAANLRLELLDTVLSTSGAQLDGEFNTGDSLPSGDLMEGFAFNFEFSVNPGDANQNGVVNGSDAGNIYFAFDKKPGEVFYSIFSDINGNGVLNGSDAGIVFFLFNGMPPASFPSSIASLQSSVSGGIDASEESDPELDAASESTLVAAPNQGTESDLDAISGGSSLGEYASAVDEVLSDLDGQLDSEVLLLSDSAN